MKVPQVPAGTSGIRVEGAVAVLRPSRAQNRGVGRIALLGFAAIVLLLLALFGPQAFYLVLAVTISTAAALFISQRTVSVTLTDEGVVQKMGPRKVRTAWDDVQKAEVVTNGRLKQVYLRLDDEVAVVLAVPTQTAVAKDPAFEAQAGYVLDWFAAVRRS